MRKLIAVLFILFIFQSCVYAESTMSRVMDSWKGENIDTVLKYWGYPNDEKISGLTVLYNNSSEEMIHYSVSYYSQPPSYNRLGDYYGQGKIIKAGDYILVSSWDKPDYWFKVAPSSVTIKTSNKSKNTGTLKYIVDFVKNLEERGFVVDDFGTIRYKK